MDFHQKHEPRNFAACAPTYDIKAFQEYLDSDNKRQVYLLSGPTGLGKTTTAKILGNWLAQGKDVQILERNMADQNTIENVREVVGDFRETTITADVRVFILDEPQRIQPKTQDVLFKALDTLPRDIYVIFCTTDPQNLKSTLRHRCHEVIFSPLSNKRQGILLRTIIEKEIWTFGTETVVTDKIMGKDDANQCIINSEGSIRKLYDNIHTVLTGGSIVPLQIEQDTINLISALKKGSWNQVASAVNSITDHEITRQRTAYTISKMLAKLEDDELLKKYGRALECMTGLIIDPDPQNTLMVKAFKAWTAINGKSSWLEE